MGKSSSADDAPLGLFLKLYFGLPQGPPGGTPEPEEASGGTGGGKEVHLHFHNAVYGFDDFQQQVAQGVRSAMYQGQYQ